MAIAMKIPAINPVAMIWIEPTAVERRLVYSSKFFEVPTGTLALTQSSDKGDVEPKDKSLRTQSLPLPVLTIMPIYVQIELIWTSRYYNFY